MPTMILNNLPTMTSQTRPTGALQMERVRRAVPFIVVPRPVSPNEISG